MVKKSQHNSLANIMIAESCPFQTMKEITSSSKPDKSPSLKWQPLSYEIRLHCPMYDIQRNCITADLDNRMQQTNMKKYSVYVLVSSQ